MKQLLIALLVTPILVFGFGNSFTTTKTDRIENNTETQITLASPLVGDTDVVVQDRLEVQSTTEASLPCPSMPTTARDSLTPANGDCIYNNTADEYQYYNETDAGWFPLGGGTEATIEDILVKYDPALDTTVDSNVYSVGSLVGINQPSSFGDLAVYDAGTDAVITLNNSVSGSTSSDGLFLRQTNNQGIIQNKENDSLVLGTNASNDFAIESDGTLHALTSNYETLLTDDDDIPNKLYVDNLAPNATTDDVVLKWDTATNRAVESNITQTSTRVGINVDPTFGDLQVHDTATDSVIHVTNATTGTTSGDGLFIRQTNNVATILNKEADVLNLGTNNSNDFRINTDRTLESLVSNYETLVVSDDIIPNKKYVDDASAGKQDASAELTALSGLTGTGLVTRTGTSTYTERSITATADETDVTNGSGVAGDIIVGLADNPVIPGSEGVTLPSGSELERPVSPNVGELRWSTTEEAAEIFDGTGWTSVGSGLGSAQTIFIVQADDDSTDISGNNATFDGGGTIDGTLSESTTAADFLTGEKKVYKYVAGASSQNDYFGFTRNIPQGWRGRTVAYEFTYRTDATYQDGDFIFQVKDNTNADLLFINGKSLDKKDSTDGNGFTYRGLVNIPVDAASIDFGFQNTSATSGIEFYVDKISFDIDDFNYKEVNAATEWIDYGGITFSATTTAPTKATSPDTDNITCRRLGDSLECRVAYRHSSNTGATAGSGTYLVKIPNGLTIDSTKVKFYTGTLAGDWVTDNVVGQGTSFDGGVNEKPMVISVYDANHVRMFDVEDDESMRSGFRPLTLPKVGYVFTFTVPIAGWQATSKHVVVDSGDAETEYYGISAITSNFWDTTAATDNFDISLIPLTDSKFIEYNDTTETRIVAKQDTIINFTVTGRQNDNTSLFAIKNNAAGTDLQYVSWQYAQGSSEWNSTQGEVKLNAGEYIYFTRSIGASREGGLHITARKATQGEYHLVPVTDQENVFSARIQNNGTCTILEQNVPFIESCNRFLLGQTTLTWKSGFFTETPSCTLGARGIATFTSTPNTTSQNVLTKSSASNPSDNDLDYNITCVFQGSQYKEPKAFIGDVPVNYFQTKYLTSLIDTATNPVTDLTFNNLVIGKVYKIEFQASLGGTSSGVAELRALHDGNVVANREFDGDSAQKTLQAAGSSGTFTATATTLTFQFVTNNAPNIDLEGDGTGATTFATLTELNHTQETTRF